MALSVAVDGAALFPGDRERLDAFERRLQAKAIEALVDNRIAIDPEGQDLHFEILRTPDGGVLIAVSSRNPELVDLSLDAAEVEHLPNVATENISAGAWKEPNLLAEVALDLFARTIATNRSSDCDPPRTLSANGRYALEVPPSHPEARERYLSSLAEEVWLDRLDPRPVASLFALSAEGEEERLSMFRLDEETAPERFLVSDDGDYVVGFDFRLPQHQRLGVPEGNTLIYRADGSVIRRLTPNDVLTPGDVEEMLRYLWTPGAYLSPLQAALDDDLDRLVLTLGRFGKSSEIAIDLATGALLTPRRDLLPQLRVTVGSSSLAGAPEGPWNPAVCFERTDEIEANRAFAAQDLVRESPPALYEQAIEKPLPSYTEIAKRARLQGTVEVEVLVSETGRVSCVRATQLPMGLDRSTEAAALRWRFQPFLRDGKPAQAVGRFSFRFGWVDPPGGQ